MPEKLKSFMVEKKSKNLNNRPKISVIIPTYYRANLLLRAIESILNQTFENFELVIVNDASPDNTEEVVKSFSDKRIVYIKHQRNRGILAAYNSGFNVAKGDYIVTISNDDEFLPNAFETIVTSFAEFSSKGVKIMWFDCIDAELGEYSGEGMIKEGYVLYKDYLCNKILGDYCMVLDKRAIGNNRFNETLWAMPTILLLKLHRKNKAYYIPKTICKLYREHEYKSSRISQPEVLLSQIPRVVLTEKAFLAEYGEEIKTLCPKYYGQKLASLSFYQILNDEKRDGRRNICESFKFNFSLKYCFLFLVSFVLNKNQIKPLYLKFLRIKRIIAFLSISFRKSLSQIKIFR